MYLRWRPVSAGRNTPRPQYARRIILSVNILEIIFIYPADGSRGGGVFSDVCLSACASVCLFIRNISKKPLQPGSPNLTKKCSTMSPGGWKPIYFGVKRSKVDVTRHKTVLEWILHSCECRLLLVNIYASYYVVSPLFPTAL